MLCACSKVELESTEAYKMTAPNVSYALTTYMTLEELVQLSDVAIIGEYVDQIRQEYYTEYIFKVKKVLYGEVADETIYLFTNNANTQVEETGYTYDSAKNVYAQGKEYILIMEKSESIMYEHDRYMLSADVCICLSDGKYTLYSENIDISRDITMEDYVCELRGNSKVENVEVKKEKIYANEIDEIIGESDFIGVVKILSLEVEGLVHNGNTYKCEITSLIEGTKEIYTLPDGSILMTIIKNTVNVGDSYIIGFSPVGEVSVIYMQTSKNSVLEFNDMVIEKLSQNLAESKK